MKMNQFTIIVVLAMVVCLPLLSFGMERASSSVLSAPAATAEAPIVTSVDPTSAPNDLDIPIVIAGTGFTAELSGTLLITPPAAYLGDTALVDVTWVSSATLQATVPWSMDPGVYTLTVVNPGGEAGSLTEAFTVTPGINIWTTGGPYGGSVISLDLGDEQGETVYATVCNVGVFRSRDGGESWELIFIEIGHANWPEVDPTNLDHLYIAKPGVAGEKAGLYWSEDGGDTWAAMPKPLPDINIASFRAFVNPHNGILYGALFSDLTDVVLGLFRFDETNQTWIRLEEAGLLDATTPVTVVGFDPVDPQTMYAGLLDGMVIQSSDGGQTWFFHSQAPLDNPKELVVNPVGGELWVCSTGGQLRGGLYMYDGDQWISMYSSPQSSFVGSLVFDPNATDVDSQHIWIATNADGILKSEDGGENWMRITPMRSEAIALNPTYPETIYSGSTEGVAKTGDGGMSWQIINEELTGIVPSYMGVSPHDPAVVYGAANSIGIFGSLNGGKTWQRCTDNVGGPIVVDPIHPLHVVNAAYGNFLIADDGWNFNREIAIPMPPGMTPEDYLAVSNAMIARPGMWLLGVGYNSELVPYWNYDGGGGIYLSEDGENWSLITPLLECPPTSLGFDPVDENIMYAVTSGMSGGVSCEGTFLRSTDGGQTWQESTAGLPYYSGGGYVSGVMAVEPTPPYRIFLGNFVSLDRGVTWSEVNGPPVASHLNQMLFLPGSPSILYAATGAGLFQTVDGAQTWQRAQGAMGQLEIWSLAGTTVDDRQILYVALVGGAVEGDGSQAMGLASDNEQLVNSGVYRLTTLSMSHRIYLPLVLR